MVDFYYKKHGNGINKIILFHGFGEDQTSFDEMVSEILAYTDTTCYVIDIYYHGKSHRHERPLLIHEWEKSFRKFLEKESIESFLLLGYSLGGRFVLATATRFPKNTKGIFLLAPDGVFQSMWYRIANSLPGNAIFKYLMNHPPIFDRLIHLFRKMGLVSKTLGRFVETTLRSPQQRKRVYQTWTYFRTLQVRPRAIVAFFNKYKTPIQVILGDQDKIIPPNRVLPKLSPIKHLQPVIINARHHQIIHESIPHIISAIKSPNL